MAPELILTISYKGDMTTEQIDRIRAALLLAPLEEQRQALLLIRELEGKAMGAIQLVAALLKRFGERQGDCFILKIPAQDLLAIHSQDFIDSFQDMGSGDLILHYHPSHKEIQK